MPASPPHSGLPRADGPLLNLFSAAIAFSSTRQSPLDSNGAAEVYPEHFDRVHKWFAKIAQWGEVVMV